MKFNEACKNYLKEIQVTTSKANNRKVTGYLKRACEFMGELESENINRNTLLDLIIHRREVNPKVSNTTLNRYIMYVQSVLNYELNIEIKFRKLKEDKKIRQVLTEFTIRKVFKYLDSLKIDEAIRNRLMFMMLLDTGLRISELLSIQVKNIDFHENMILVTKTKTREQRYVIMTEETKMFLSNYILTCSIDKHIFINLDTRKKLHPDSIQTICKRIKEKMKLEQSITPHKWRHTFATRFIENDGNLFVLQKLLGHHDVSTTQIYTHISMKKVKMEYNKIVQNMRQRSGRPMPKTIKTKNCVQTKKPLKGLVM